MLKSLNLINILSKKLDALIYNRSIINYLLDLKLSHKLTVYIVSNDIQNKEDLLMLTEEIIDLEKLEISFEFLDEKMCESDEYSFLFENGKINFGVRRSLQNLISPKSKDNADIMTPIVTFYSYKGGVGRTTALALFSSYYSNLGKNVFVIDCDFEAPGLVNFFNLSQFDNPKNGIIEYINDKKFDNSLKLNDEYVYEISSAFSGEGRIHMMPAGNVFGDEKEHYLEGLARIDIQGDDILFNEFKSLIKEVEKVYAPDLILFDSRTGFNNIFGTLSQLSNLVIALSGDDCQNEPGLEFLLEYFPNKKIEAKICIVLSILSSSVNKRLEKFKDKIKSFCGSYEIENELPVFYFLRENLLELLGTGFEDYEDIKIFLSHNTSSYSPFFSFLSSYIEKLNSEVETNNNIEDDFIDNSPKNENYSNEHINNSQIVDKCDNEGKSLNFDEISDTILKNLTDNFPEQYAENMSFEESFFNNKFYIRKCMQDLFLPEYKILLGGKGTGKTAFYRALQNDIFFNILVKRSEKEHLNFKIQHIISESDSSIKEGFIDFSAQFGSDINDESFVRKFWVIYLWISIKKSQNNGKHPLYFSIKNDLKTAKKFKNIITNDGDYISIEEDLSNIDNNLKKQDRRLIVTLDQLDFVVKPLQWDQGISPLIRLCQSNTWSRIQPKLFLRRDLFNKLGNITNKNALAKQTVNLEWSKEEMFAFFFKIIFAYSKNDFLKFLYNKYNKSFVNKEIKKKLSRENQFNQLPPDHAILKPLAEAFFGVNEYEWQGAYDYLYNILKNADRTVSLRPFLDLIRLSIAEQVKDNAARRKDAILDLNYCRLRSVRSQAVDTYFKDLANEAGNDLIKHFVEDIRSSKVPNELKHSSLLQRDFEELVSCVQKNHSELKNKSIIDFEEMLVLNGIIFVTFIPGGRKKFSFAFLYKYYMELKPPKKGVGRNVK